MSELPITKVSPHPSPGHTKGAQTQSSAVDLLILNGPSVRGFRSNRHGEQQRAKHQQKQDLNAFKSDSILSRSPSLSVEDLHLTTVQFHPSLEAKLTHEDSSWRIDQEHLILESHVLVKIDSEVSSQSMHHDSESDLNEEFNISHPNTNSTQLRESSLISVVKSQRKRSVARKSIDTCTTYNDADDERSVKESRSKPPSIPLPPCSARGRKLSCSLRSNRRGIDIERKDLRITSHHTSGPRRTMKYLLGLSRKSPAEGEEEKKLRKGFFRHLTTKDRLGPQALKLMSVKNVVHELKNTWNRSRSKIAATLNPADVENNARRHLAAPQWTTREWSYTLKDRAEADSRIANTSTSIQEEGVEATTVSPERDEGRGQKIVLIQDEGSDIESETRLGTPEPDQPRLLSWEQHLQRDLARRRRRNKALDLTNGETLDQHDQFLHSSPPHEASIPILPKSDVYMDMTTTTTPNTSRRGSIASHTVTEINDTPQRHLCPGPQSKAQRTYPGHELSAFSWSTTMSDPPSGHFSSSPLLNPDSDVYSRDLSKPQIYSDQENPVVAWRNLSRDYDQTRFDSEINEPRNDYDRPQERMSYRSSNVRSRSTTMDYDTANVSDVSPCALTWSQSHSHTISSRCSSTSSSSTTSPPIATSNLPQIPHRDETELIPTALKIPSRRSRHEPNRRRQGHENLPRSRKISMPKYPPLLPHISPGPVTLNTVPSRYHSSVTSPSSPSPSLPSASLSPSPSPPCSASFHSSPPPFPPQRNLKRKSGNWCLHSPENAGSDEYEKYGDQCESECGSEGEDNRGYGHGYECMSTDNDDECDGCDEHHDYYHDNDECHSDEDGDDECDKDERKEKNNNNNNKRLSELSIHPLQTEFVSGLMVHRI